MSTKDLFFITDHTHARTAYKCGAPVPKTIEDAVVDKLTKMKVVGTKQQLDGATKAK